MRPVVAELEGRTAVDAARVLTERGIPTAAGNRVWHCKQVRRLRLRLEAQAPPDARTAAAGASSGDSPQTAPDEAADCATTNLRHVGRYTPESCRGGRRP